MTNHVLFARQRLLIAYSVARPILLQRHKAPANIATTNQAKDHLLMVKTAFNALQTVPPAMTMADVFRAFQIYF